MSDMKTSEFAASFFFDSTRTDPKERRIGAVIEGVFMGGIIGLLSIGILEPSQAIAMTTLKVLMTHGYNKQDRQRAA